MDAITLLREDHKTVKRLFQRIDKLSDGAKTQLKRLVDEVVKDLSIHAAIEEQVFYPAVRKHAPEALDMVLESLEEHHIVKWVLSEIDGMQPSDERYKAKVTVLKENVLHHADEEEKDLFPMVRKAMTRTELQELGAMLAKAKKTAPTRPHPRTPDTPPLNLVAGALTGATDRARDRGRQAVSRAKKTTAKRTMTKRATTKRATAQRPTTQRATTRSGPRR